MTTAPTARADALRAQGGPSHLPRDRAVLEEQFRAIGRLLRTPMLIAVVLALLATIVLAIQIVSGDLSRSLHTEPSSLPGIVGALLPIAVWAREERFGPGFLWTLPVDRRRHALLKTVAGWLWLMGGAALFTLALLLLALLSGAGLLPVKELRVLAAPLTIVGPLDPDVLRTVRWAPGPLIWAIPFVSATATYLLVSAIMLGIRHPLRWIGGAVLAIPLAGVITHAGSRVLGAAWLADAPGRAIMLLVEGRYGLEALLTLRTWSLDHRAVLTTGERVHVWSAAPDLADWRTAALLWTGAGLLALWFAASRHRERRRA